ncbi:chemotaxis response regulator protein-glutamate methylesterase [Desulfuribacillus stibiiarsenatis]|uniref:Protein-glutamate methylesterase/protein-glutamine glutaminase n=1 Tax=Desulfuribacillus stibiiarsenatis TaxID=1390249 RepID=A0A1E5L6N2_9FIRM|nr:chemotaxis response regulator protein-glutamate methylesterase [Desulfuribacillus stibiiarsenatis]OEH85629.1 chemotaxis response regulator protein-glutamate methylesterase [Desulfuribacillus stibiiarsenatis]
MSKIRVLIIDDSALVREVLRRVLSQDPEIDVVGSAVDPIQAISKIKELKPHVITLDLEMPKMDGLTFLRKLMNVVPLPVIVISSKALEGSDATITALELGAVDFITKPAVGVGEGLATLQGEITEKVKCAATVNMRALYNTNRKRILPPSENESISQRSTIKNTDKIIAIGGSTGGTVAVRTIMQALPANCPAILITLHMPAGFTKSYAEGLDKVCRMNVKEAEHGEQVRKGYAYVAPGGKHMLLAKKNNSFTIEITETPPVNHHRPSVDVTFQSVANTSGSNTIGVILTGMGSDGAVGLKTLHDRGAYTIAQDEATCTVFGMPKQAIALGATDIVLPIQKISNEIVQFLSQ